MLTFYLIRHGQKENIPFDPPLTKRGELQAKLTFKYLKTVKFTAVFCSPKLRTRQTAQIISASTLPVHYDDRLIERLEWEESVEFKEFVNEWRKTDLDRNHTPIIGDSSIGKGKKMREVIDELYLIYKKGNILIVSHGGAIGDLLRNIFDKTNLKEDLDPVTNAPHIHISECSITKITKDSKLFSLTDLNYTDHLPYELISRD